MRVTCKQCGKPLVSPGFGRQYCNRSCQSKRQRAVKRARGLIGNTMKYCIVCGCEIGRKRGNHKYCDKHRPEKQQQVIEGRKNAEAVSDDTPPRLSVQCDFTHRSLMRCPANKLPSVVNGIIDGRNTLTGVRR